MDDLTVGRLFRALRVRRRLRQQDVADLAHVSQPMVSAAEQGRLNEISLDRVRSIARSLGISLPFEPRGYRGDLERLLDGDHAAIVERVVGWLRARGWEVVVEYSFNHFGERGSVDIVAWHAGLASMLLIEVKTRIVDVQELLATFGRKLRIVPRLLADERGWRPRSIGRVLVVADTTANRNAIARHKETFAVAFPASARAIRSWLRKPVSNVGGVWFVADQGGGRRSPSPRRVRVRASSR